MTPSWQTTPGLVYRARDGQIVRTPSGPQPPAAAALGIVDRDVYDLSLYSHHSMLASVGCPCRCRFCANFAGRMLAGGGVRPLDRIFEEMHYLADRYDARQVFFADDVFLLTGENVTAFCDRIEREGPRIEWIVQMRTDAVDARVAGAMASAGCRRVYFGVESGSDAILRRSGKGIDCRSIRQAVHAAKQAGLRVKTGWIYGLPGTLEEQYASIDLMRELRPHEISLHQLIPFPGTDYYARPGDFGLRIRDPKDFAGFCYGGLSDNVSYDYLPREALVTLIEDTVSALESDGYVSSDRAAPGDAYVFSTPLNAVSMRVFQ